MAFQRVWLAASSAGLSLQPLTGALFFHQRIAAGEGDAFTPAHQKLVSSAYDIIASAFGASGTLVGILFRVGYADPPTARSLRLPPNPI
jgi:hypothetical protein